MWSLKLSKQAFDFYENMTGKHKLQMDHSFELLCKDPKSGKPLKGELKNYWSFRVGQYRIIYSIYEKEVVVAALRIQHRKEVYEKFKRK